MLCIVCYRVLEILNLVLGNLTSFDNSKRHIPFVQVNLYIY